MKGTAHLASPTRTPDTAAMQTSCPACHALFRIARADLEAAGGWVCCGECGHVFDARSALQQELPFEADAETGGAVSAGAAAQDNHANAVPAQSPGSGTSVRASRALHGLLISDLEAESDGRARRAEARSWWGIALWGMVNAALVAALAVQLLFVQREAFAQDPSLRPVLVQLCAVAGCTLPPRRDLDRIELTRRHVYDHPNVEGALLIDLTLVNQAPFAQPYPVLAVTLGDLRGEPVARRHFEPREYEPRLGAQARMAPGSPVNIVLEVRDPGPDARTFDLDFY